MSESAGALPRADLSSHALAELCAQRQQTRETLVAARQELARLGQRLGEVGGFDIGKMAPIADHGLRLSQVRAGTAEIADAIAGIDAELRQSRSELGTLSQGIEAEQQRRRQRRTARLGLLLILGTIVAIGAIRLLTASG